MTPRWPTAVTSILLCACGVQPDGPPGPLDGREVVAIRQLDSTFVTAWLADDTTRVLSVFAPNAVLLPPSSEPVVGIPAIRSYWWPTDGSHTRILTFDRQIAEIGGGSHLAFIRGTGTLTWTHTKNGVTSSQRGRSTDLFLLAPDSAGRWRIIRQIWNSLP